MNLLLAFNRFSAVVFGHKHEHIFSTFNGILYIAIIYAGSAIMNIPGFMFLSKYYPELGTFNYLHMPSQEFLKFSIFIEMAAVYAVHLAIFVLYAIISGSPCFILMTCHHIIHFPLLEVLAGELCVGIDPIIYVWFNKEIRTDFFEISGIKKFSKRFTSNSI
uniref:7TM GPCR serpentine receptor class x (Srx) domain-containing protein n=1 Tax=Panagrolaimus davidi TaxID=227884 RepID=A0A914PH29_9BILA